MAISKSESKYLNTAHLMDEALLKLLEDKDFDYITIKDVCNKAGVNRSTFYLHYETMVELLEEAIKYQNELFWSCFSIKEIDIKTVDLKDLFFLNETYLTPYLNFLKDNKMVLKVAIEKADILQSKKMYKDLYDKIFSPILSRFNIPENDKNYFLMFYIHGINAVVSEWIKKNCVDSIEHIIKLLAVFVPQIEK